MLSLAIGRRRARNSAVSSKFPMDTWAGMASVSKADAVSAALSEKTEGKNGPSSEFS